MSDLLAMFGVDNAIWSDHTDIQPTMLALLGLHTARGSGGGRR